MGLTMKQQKAFASQMAKRYRQASKKKKGQIIEQYMGLTGARQPLSFSRGSAKGRPAKARVLTGRRMREDRSLRERRA